MFPYWLLFSVFLAGSLQNPGIQRRTKVTPLSWAAIVLTALMIGFRYEVGGDWKNYQTIYQSFRHLELENVFTMGEPGYALLNWLGHALGLEVWFVNLVCGGIFAWGLQRFAREQPNPWLAILVAVPYLIIVVAMGYARQAVAIGFILAGLSRLERNSLLQFSLYVVCAVAFHKTAMIVLPLAALAVSRNQILTMSLLALTGALLFYLVLAPSMDTLLVNYVQAKYASEGAGIRVAMNLVPAAIFIMFHRRFGLNEVPRKLWRNFAIASFAALAALLTTASSTAVDRLALYLLPLQIFVLSGLPYALSRGGKANTQLMLAVIVYSAAIQFVWLNFATHAAFWVPYKLYPFWRT